MKSGTRIRVIETGEIGTVRGIHYHYSDSKNHLEKILVLLDKSNEMITFNAEEVSSYLGVIEENDVK